MDVPGSGGWPTLFRPRLTNRVGAPSFPIVWERVGVDDVHTFECRGWNPVTPPVNSRKRVGHPIFFTPPFREDAKEWGTPTRVWSRKRVGHSTTFTPPFFQKMEKEWGTRTQDNELWNRRSSPHPFPNDGKGWGTLKHVGWCSTSPNQSLFCSYTRPDHAFPSGAPLRYTSLALHHVQLLPAHPSAE